MAVILKTKLQAAIKTEVQQILLTWGQLQGSGGGTREEFPPSKVSEREGEKVIYVFFCIFFVFWNISSKQPSKDVSTVERREHRRKT